MRNVIFCKSPVCCLLEDSNIRVFDTFDLSLTCTL